MWNTIRGSGRFYIWSRKCIIECRNILTENYRIVYVDVEFIEDNLADDKKRATNMEKNVTKLTKNLRRALAKVAPIKVINVRKEQEPWKENDEVSRQKKSW